MARILVEKCGLCWHCSCESGAPKPDITSYRTKKKAIFAAFEAFKKNKQDGFIDVNRADGSLMYTMRVFDGGKRMLPDKKEAKQ